MPVSVPWLGLADRYRQSHSVKSLLPFQNLEKEEKPIQLAFISANSPPTYTPVPSCKFKKNANFIRRQFQEDEVVMEGQDLCCAWRLIIKSRAEPKSYPDRDLKSLHMGILGFMVYPVIKNWEQNGTAAQKYAYLGKIRDIWAWKMAPDSSLIEITLYKKTLCVNIRLCLTPGQKSARKRADTRKSVNGQKRMNSSERLR